MSPPEPGGSVRCCPAWNLLCWRSPMGAGLSQTQDGGVSAAQHASQPATMAEVVRERKRKMNGGLATLRRRLLAGGRRGNRGGRASRSGDRAAPLRDLLKEWSPLEVGALLEEYEALAALRDLCVQAELARPPAAALRGDLATLYDRRICPDAELIFKGTCFPVHRAILSARCPYFRDLLNGYPSLGARVCLEAPLPTQIDIATVDGLLRYLYTGEPANPPCPSCDEEVCDARHIGSVPDCCPSQTDAVHSQSGSNRLTLDIVGGGNGCHRRPDPGLLRRIATDLGAAPSGLHRDMRHLLDTAEFADASLVFTSEPPPSGASTGNQQSPESVMMGGAVPNFTRSVPVARAGSPPSSSEYGFRPRLELPCHRAILSARSPFFKSVIQRRSRQHGNSNEAFGSVKIVLDERVIPHKYARVLLHAVYTDQVDLNLVMRGGSSIFGCSLLGNHNSNIGEAQALANNQQNANVAPQHSLSPLEEAMELYEIGRFLELDILSQGCEDIIAERLSANSLASVLKWSAQPHGSKWVHRQALRFLREEFLTVAAGPALTQLEASHLAHALRCPFLQASELDALRATLRWGEYHLIKRMEDREPNLLSHTAHSVTRKGVKKRDLSDAELRELLADLLPLVRIDHILPPNNELLSQAIRRGLLSSPPSYMLGDEGSGGSRADAWIRGKGGLYVRPRLYMPYYEEVKALLEDQLVQEAELLRMRRARYIPDIPDTLYMVSAEPRARSSASAAPAESPRGGNGSSDMDNSSRLADRNTSGGEAANGDAVPPAPATMRSMLARERELRRAPACMRATSLPLSHTAEVNRQIRLRVVREFNLPDTVADTLEGAALIFEGSCSNGRRSSPCDVSSARIRDHCGDQISRDGLRLDDENREDISGVQNIQNSRKCIDSWCIDSPESNRHLPALLTEGENNRSHSVDSTRQQKFTTPQTGRGLSEAMPDVAMATSSLGRLRISTFAQQHNHPGFARNTHNSNQLESFNFDVSSNGFYSLKCASKAHSDSNHSLSREGSTAHTPVSFMNPNQHLLQEGCGLGVFSYKGRDLRKSQKHSNSSTQHTSERSGSQENAQSQRAENGNGPSLQLDLGDGNQHASPGKQSSGSHSSWNNQLDETQPQEKHERKRILSAGVSSEYGQTQISGSPSNRTNYSRYLSTQPATQSNTQHQLQSQDEDSSKPQTSGQAPPSLSSPIPSSTSNFVPASPFRITNGPLSTSTNNNANPSQSSGFSTLQHHSRNRSPRRSHANATLQRSRPACPNTAPLCVAPKNQCSGSTNTCSGSMNICPILTTCAVPILDKDMHRSQSAGSIASIGLDPEKRENKTGFPNSSGYNHMSSFGGPSLSSEASNQVAASYNTLNFGHSHIRESPRHFRSISTLPDQVILYGDNSNSRNVNYQIGTNLIENSVNRNQFETYPNWIQSGAQYISSDDRNQYFLRNSRDNFYSGATNYTIQREGSFRTVSSSSPFQNENSSYSVNLEGSFSGLQQNSRPGSCGLVDAVNVNAYSSNSRGESPLYGTMNSSSRGSSPFRTLDPVPNQFSRGNSPYSSSHRMDYNNRMQNENYCQGSGQRSSSPCFRNPYPNRTVSGSPGLKIPPQQGSRVLSSSPSLGNYSGQPIMSKVRTISGSPTGNNTMIKQGSRTLSNSPSINFTQGSNMKMHQNSRVILPSPSSTAPINFSHGSLKSQQRSSTGVGTSGSNSTKTDNFSSGGFCQQNSRDVVKSQTLRLSSSQYHVGNSGPPKYL